MLRPYPGSKQEVRQISLPKSKITAKLLLQDTAFWHTDLLILLLQLMKIFLQLITKKKYLKTFTFVKGKHRSFPDQADHSIDLFWASVRCWGGKRRDKGDHLTDESLNLHSTEEGVEWESSDSSDWLSEFAFLMDLPAELMERNTTYEQTKMKR